MNDLLQDVRIALRSFRRAPLIAFVAVFSLAIGVAANTTIFAAVDVFLFRPLPYAEAERLVQMWSLNRERGWRELSVSIPDFVDWRERSTTVTTAGYGLASFNLAGSGEQAERVTGARISANLLDVLGRRPVHGRNFRAEEERAGHAVALISDRLWQRRYAGSPDVLGSTIMLDGRPHTVIGVLGDFEMPSAQADVWTPLGIEGTEARDLRSMTVLGRLRGTATVEQASAEIERIAADLEAQYPTSNRAIGAHMATLHNAMVDTEFRIASTTVSVAAIFVLLIACANIANLQLARSMGRQRELTVRAALGAGRMRLVRQLLTESMMLALLGGAAGTLLSIWGIRWLVSIMPEWFPRVDEIGLDARTLGYGLAVTVFAGVAVGLAPALRAARSNLSGALRESGGRGATIGGKRARLRGALVAMEIGMAVVLLVCSVLLIKAYSRMSGGELGFDPDGIMTMRVVLPEATYPDSLQAITFHTALTERLRGLGAVEAVGATTLLPLRGGNGTFYMIASAPPADTSMKPIAQWRGVMPGYFETFGIATTRGRAFTDGDNLTGPPVAIINERFAQQNFPDRDPLGERIVLASGERTIVGVVSDTRDLGTDDEVPPMMYFPVLQRGYRALSYVVRARVDDEAIAAALRTELAAIDPTIAAFEIRSMPATIERDLAGHRVLTELLGILAGIALLMAVLGVYGVMAYSVTQRIQEVGIRMALGAQRRDILRLIVRQGSRLAAFGLVGGLLLTLLVTRFLTAFLHDVSPFDLQAFVGVTLALGGAALLASYLPAQRATRVDPIIALRND